MPDDSPSAGEPWTQDYLLERMEEEIGWAPHRPNYSRYEQGRTTPGRVTLGKFVKFWAGRGEPEPDLTPKVEEPEPSLAVAIKFQADAIRQQTAAINRLVAVLAARELPDTPEGSDLMRELSTWAKTAARAGVQEVELRAGELVAQGRAP